MENLHENLYNLDDLLVSATKDIIANGYENSVIPTHIKSWIAEKMVLSLPKTFVNKLLSFIIDQRDISDTLACRETITERTHQLTMTIYTSNQAMVRNERNPRDDLFVNDKNTSEYNFDFNDFYEDNLIVDMKNNLVPFASVDANAGTNFGAFKDLKPVFSS